MSSLLRALKILHETIGIDQRAAGLITTEAFGLITTGLFCESKFFRSWRRKPGTKKINLNPNILMWNKQSEQPLPFGKRIIFTNGKEAVIGIIEENLVEEGNIKRYWHFLRPEGVGGYEMEVEFDYSDITHWMPVPTLP